MQVVAAINRVMFDELGFKGNEGEYYDPRNSFVTEVLRRRMGIPITLALVYVCVAERLGLRVQGVNAPSHFLLRVRDTMGGGTGGDGHYFIDVFNKGKVMSLDGVQVLLTALGWAPFGRIQLPECPPRSLFARMLRNLTAVYQAAGQTSSFILCLSQLLEVVRATDGESVEHYEQQIDEYRWTSSARILNP
uniref:Protein SirB1 N-terminal domain-containing protein n=2 Tax=Hemiselmis andersenii TaxID=464988 RepID=A0A7S0TW98_HEMAN|mmetsp:Transcript_26242/g.60789  ORF Transcript_26242/g.60789 Transcript_26242/m.60789 type:complete len:191 (+) Transcript_26242:215-787(+)